MSGTAVSDERLFRRPTRDDAVTLAREQFLSGERVEMNSLAARLGINRTTLYRWVGERDQLIGEVFSGLIDEWLAPIVPTARGHGFERFLDILRRFLEFASAFEPLTDFTQREPALALRILTVRDGAVSRKNDETIARLLAELEPNRPVGAEIVRAIGLVARTLVWANIAVDREPDIDGAVEVARTLLAS